MSFYLVLKIESSLSAMGNRLLVMEILTIPPPPPLPLKKIV